MNNNGQSAWISNKSNAKLIADWLGDYRDASAGITFLRQSYIKNLPEEEQILLQDIKQNWILEKENIRQKIYNTLKNNQATSD